MVLVIYWFFFEAGEVVTQAMAARIDQLVLGWRLGAGPFVLGKKVG